MIEVSSYKGVGTPKTEFTSIVDNFTGDGSSNTFTLSTNPQNENHKYSQPESIKKDEAKNEELDFTIKSNTIKFPAKPKEEEIIFEDSEDEIGLEGGAFFIPPAARRVANMKGGKETNNYNKIFTNQA